MPHAIMVSATTLRIWSNPPPISRTRTTGRTSVEDIRKMCWIDRSRRVPRGRVSSTP